MTLPGAKVVLRKRPRKHRASPVRGLSLLASGVDRLGLWPKLWEQWVCRTFALTLHRCVPRLSAFTRAEKLADGTLTVVVTSSAVASELSFVRDLLLEQVNRELLEAVGRLDHKQRRMARPVLRLHHRVGKLAGLPDPAEWQERPTPRRRPPPPKVTIETQLAVATASQDLRDEDLRLLLLRLVGATTRTS
ncbi:MAG: DUF721 domain-containing protein [Myxococcales bacterium]|nr:DUF721 domain-containing protein [Myxococcales bacterium]